MYIFTLSLSTINISIESLSPWDLQLPKTRVWQYADVLVGFCLRHGRNLLELSCSLFRDWTVEKKKGELPWSKCLAASGSHLLFALRSYIRLKAAAETETTTPKQRPHFDNWKIGFILSVGLWSTPPITQSDWDSWTIVFNHTSEQFLNHRFRLSQWSLRSPTSFPHSS